MDHVIALARRGRDPQNRAPPTIRPPRPVNHRARHHSQLIHLVFESALLPQEADSSQDGETYPAGAFQYAPYREHLRCVHQLTFAPPDFKSYKGHHTLLFGDAYFTSIIGPNGSGKSNSYVIR